MLGGRLQKVQEYSKLFYNCLCVKPAEPCLKGGFQASKRSGWHDAKPCWLRKSQQKQSLPCKQTKKTLSNKQHTQLLLMCSTNQTNKHNITKQNTLSAWQQVTQPRNKQECFHTCAKRQDQKIQLWYREHLGGNLLPATISRTI